MEPSRLRILVVEDEALIAENLRLTLEDLGYEVPATCYTFAEATAALAAPPPVADLVLLDINLGNADAQLSGLALARQLRAQGGPPFIFLTAYSDLATIRQATQLQPSGYLIKPVGGPALFAAIQSALEYAATHQPAPAPAPATPPPAPSFFFVKLGERTHKLHWTEVQRLEAGKNYVTLHVAGQRAGYPLRGSLTYVLDQLLPPALAGQFLRVNRRLALNKAAITSYDDEHLYCGPGECHAHGRTALQLTQELGRG